MKHALFVANELTVKAENLSAVTLHIVPVYPISLGCRAI